VPNPDCPPLPDTFRTAAQASQLILDLVQPLSGAAPEWVDLAAAGGRILAAAVTSQQDFPYWDNSAMDGYAVRFADIAHCSETAPTILAVAMEIPAGTAPKTRLQPGQAARLFTGSMLPVGADTVVPQEDTERDTGGAVQILKPFPQGAFVRRQGEYYQAGQPLLSSGMVINAPELAILATTQTVRVPVYRRPVVALLSTGSELVAPDQPLAPGQIVDSNQVALAHLVAKTGALVKGLGRIGDNPAALRAAITAALPEVDLIVSSGGVSVGDYDYVEQVLAELQAEIPIKSVAVKPGKPLTVASLTSAKGPVLYFGLPGNPVSALVSFWRFLQPALKKCSGLAEPWGPAFSQGITQQPLKGDHRRETYVWGYAHLVQGQYQFCLAAGSQASGNLINLAGINCLAVIPAGIEKVSAGETLTLMLLE
jgi:molybdopterin molybdotransferase